MWRTANATGFLRSPDGEGSGGSGEGEGHQSNPNTDRELRKARDDARRYREEAERLRGDVDTLKKESDGLRGKLKQAGDEFTAFRGASEQSTATLKAEHEVALAEIKASGDREVISAELRAELVKAGARDPAKVAKLIDASSLKRGEDGGVAGVAELIAAAKKDSDWMFGSASSTSTAKAPESGQKTHPKPATEWTSEEARAFEQKHGIYR